MKRDTQSIGFSPCDQQIYRRRTKCFTPCSSDRTSNRDRPSCASVSSPRRRAAEISRPTPTKWRPTMSSRSTIPTSTEELSKISSGICYKTSFKLERCLMNALCRCWIGEDFWTERVWSCGRWWRRWRRFMRRRSTSATDWWKSASSTWPNSSVPITSWRSSNVAPSMHLCQAKTNWLVLLQ